MQGAPARMRVLPLPWGACLEAARGDITGCCTSFSALCVPCATAALLAPGLRQNVERGCRRAGGCGSGCGGGEGGGDSGPARKDGRCVRACGGRSLQIVHTRPRVAVRAVGAGRGDSNGGRSRRDPHRVQCERWGRAGATATAGAGRHVAHLVPNRLRELGRSTS